LSRVDNVYRQDEANERIVVVGAMRLSGDATSGAAQICDIARDTTNAAGASLNIA